MRAFEDLFIETKSKKRSVKECTDRDNFFVISNNRYIYTTDEEFAILNKIKYHSTFERLNQQDIHDIFSTIYFLDRDSYSTRFDVLYNPEENFDVFICYDDIISIHIRNKNEFVLEIDSSIEVIADFAQDLVFTDSGFYNYTYKRVNGYWTFEGIDNWKDEDNLIKWGKQFIAANLDDTFIEICNNGDVDDAYLVYSMETIGSKIMPFKYFSELYELVKS